eukprot:365826_1
MNTMMHCLIVSTLMTFSIVSGCGNRYANGIESRLSVKTARNKHGNNADTNDDVAVNILHYSYAAQGYVWSGWVKFNQGSCNFFEKDNTDYFHGFDTYKTWQDNTFDYGFHKVSFYICRSRSDSDNWMMESYSYYDGTGITTVSDFSNVDSKCRKDGGKRVKLHAKDCPQHTFQGSYEVSDGPTPPNCDSLPTTWGESNYFRTFLPWKETTCLGIVMIMIVSACIVYFMLSKSEYVKVAADYIEEDEEEEEEEEALI